MRTFLLATLFLFSQATLPAEFDRPWTNPATPLILDPFRGNAIDWDKLKAEPRVVAIIHKSTIGTTSIDPTYMSRREEARRRGYLWGSYHWGVAGDPEKQADYYVDTVKPASDELMALDLEDANSSTLMNATEALRFIKRVKERTGRYPVLYANHKSALQISQDFKDSDFGKVPLWYARFKPSISDFPAGVWKTYTIWQFSSEILPQLAIPGTESDMDVNVYNGSIEELRAKWPLTFIR